MPHCDAFIELKNRLVDEVKQTTFQNSNGKISGGECVGCGGVVVW